MKIVGLTGGIATGKSTVGAILREMGVPVLDADQVARDVVRPGEPALAELVSAFGAEVLDADGGLDRRAMRQRIVSDPAARKRLEAITHPRIRQQMAEQIMGLAAKGHPAVVVEAALLVETGSYRDYPALIVVSCSDERQIERVMARDQVSEAEARAVVAAQLPMADKERVATYVIRNDGTLEELGARTREVWARVTS
jgi:dephospho-CoA kinase